MIANKPKILTYPSDSTVATISVSNGTGIHTTNKIIGRVLNFSIVPPDKSSDHTVNTAIGSATININIA
ncbi:hypothetical protein HYU06_07370 [Candidatus Woesearchaeota archaeon]|nr:hypothetical protein [Candidatus Woesearchaeota archaeon]